MGKEALLSPNISHYSRSSFMHFSKGVGGNVSLYIVVLSIGISPGGGHSLAVPLS